MGNRWKHLVWTLGSENATDCTRGPGRRLQHPIAHVPCVRSFDFASPAKPRADRHTVIAIRGARLGLPCGASVAV